MISNILFCIDSIINGRYIREFICHFNDFEGVVGLQWYGLNDSNRWWGIEPIGREITIGGIQNISIFIGIGS